MGIKQYKKISELDTIVSASLNTYVAGVDNGNTVKITLDVLANSVRGTINTLDDQRLSSLENYTASFSTSLPIGTISGSSQLTSSYDLRYTLSGSVQSLPLNIISSSAQISNYGFISESVNIELLNDFTSSQNVLNIAFTNGINARLQTSSFNDFSASVHSEILAATNEQSFDGLISSSQQITDFGFISQSVDIADFIFTTDTITNSSITLHATDSDIILNADGNVYKGSASAGNGLVTDGYLGVIIGDESRINTGTGHSITDNLDGITNYVNQFTASYLIDSSSLVDRLNTLENNTGSYLTSLPNGLISGSSQIEGFETTGRGIISGSISYTSLTNIPNGIISGSTQLTGSFVKNSQTSSMFVGYANLAITLNASNNQDYSIVFVPSGSNGYLQTYTDNMSDLLYNPSTNRLKAGYFSGIIEATNGVISGSSQLTSSYDLRYTLSGSVTAVPDGTISSSAQITAYGFISSSTSIPTGTISSSAQILSLGFASGSFETTGRGIISSSTQIVGLGFTTTSSFNSYTASQSTASLVASITNLNTATSSLYTSSSLMSASIVSLQNFNGYSINYVSKVGAQVSSNVDGFAIISASITTSGRPVQIMVTGDANPTSTNGQWVRLGLYRDSTAIGNQVQVESSAVNENNAYALQYVDNPSAGTYTYYLKQISPAGGTFQYGETAGPVLTLIELGASTTALAVPVGTISSSAQITSFGFVSGSYETTGRGIVSSSLQTTTWGYVTSGSNTFIGNQIISGTLNITGSLTANLTNGNMWVGNSLNRNYEFPTASLVFTSSFNTLSASLSSLSQSAYTTDVQVSSSIATLQASLGSTSNAFSFINSTNPTNLQLISYPTASFNGGVIDILAVNNGNGTATSTNYQFASYGANVGISQNGKQTSGAGAPNLAPSIAISGSSVIITVSLTGTFNIKGVARLF